MFLNMIIQAVDVCNNLVTLPPIEQIQAEYAQLENYLAEQRESNNGNSNS